jgi:hypothetical protein
MMEVIQSSLDRLYFAVGAVDLRWMLLSCLEQVLPLADKQKDLFYFACVYKMVIDD